MPKIKTFDILSSLNLYLLFFVMVLLVFAADTLLFKSDYISLIHLIMAIHFMMTAFASILIFPFYFSRDELKKNIFSFLTTQVVTIVTFSFLVTIFYDAKRADSFFKWINKTTQFYPWILGKIVFVLMIICLYFFCQFIVKRVIKGDLFSQRVLQLAKPLMIGEVILLFSLTLYNYVGGYLGSHQNEKNIVYIVMDGLSPYELPIYNPEVKNEKFQDFLKDFLVFKNIRTNFTFTCDYFSTFYRGNKLHNSYTDKNIPLSEKNLMTLLQQKGISTKWSAFHLNGSPDSHEIYNYKGVRSHYLNAKTSILPAILGIDYNEYRFTGTNANDSAIVKFLQKLIIGEKHEEGDFKLDSYMVKEMESLRKKNRPFFFVVHTNVYGDANVANKPKELWEDFQFKTKEDANNVLKKHGFTHRKVEKNIRRRDYRYQEKEAWYADFWANDYQDHIRIGQKVLYDFFKQLKEKNWDKDTIVIVTADHGKIHARGKLLYGFHNDEEVARVPFFVFDGGEHKGVDERLGETIDITQTLLEHFHVAERLSDSSLSLFGDKQKERVTTLTMKSEVRREHFLNVYQKEGSEIHKYVFDMFKGYDQLIDAGVVQGFSVKPYTAVQVKLDAVKELALDKIIQDHGIVGYANYFINKRTLVRQESL